MRLQAERVKRAKGMQGQDVAVGGRGGGRGRDHKGGGSGAGSVHPRAIELVAAQIGEAE